MINRRELLVGSSAIALSYLLTGCSSNQRAALRATLLEGAIPPAALKKFIQQSKEQVNFRSLVQMQAAFQYLQRLQTSPEETSSSALSRFLPWVNKDNAQGRLDNLVSLGDYWLESAIAQNLIEPLKIDRDRLNPLPIDWQRFVTRNSKGQLDESGALWAAPYKVQALVVVYRQSQFAADNPFPAWRSLLGSHLRRSIALPDHPRIVFGLLQKIKAESFNTGFDSTPSGGKSEAQLVEQLRAQLAQPFEQLNRQVRVYDSQSALKALVNEDVKAAVAWSGDVITALRRYQDLRAVVPTDGSLLSADVWVKPKGAQSNKTVESWIDFCWQPEPATTISAAGRGISPIFLGEAAAVPKALANSLLAPSKLRNSEPLLPLPAAMKAAYFSLWRRLRAG